MRRTTKDFAEVLRRQITGDAELAAQVETEDLNANIAVQIFASRRKAEMTQGELAARVGTKQSVISRLEDANYDAHSLSMLKKIAEATGMKLRVQFIPNEETCLSSLNSQTVYSETLDWPAVPVARSYEMRFTTAD